MVAVKDRLERAEEPVRPPEARRTSRIEKVKASPMMWDPVRFLESCPSSDGACAVVFTDRGGRRGRGRGRPSAGVGPRLRGALGAVAVPGTRPGRGRRARSTAPPTSTRRPASPTRSSRSTAPSCTCRSAGTSRCGSRRTTSPSRARAGRWSSAATPRSTGSFPVNMSGGVLSSNPIGASGLLRFAEAALQVRGHGRGAPGRRGEGRRWPRPTARRRSTSRCGWWRAPPIRSATSAYRLIISFPR